MTSCVLDCWEVVQRNPISTSRFTHIDMSIYLTGQTPFKETVDSSNKMGRGRQITIITTYNALEGCRSFRRGWSKHTAEVDYGIKPKSPRVVV